MPPDYFTRVSGRIQQGIWRLISSKEICSLDHLNVPTELGNFSVNHFRQFHSARSGTFMDLHSIVRPGTIAAAQASLHISNQRNNLSVVRVLSRAISLPSISGSSFQACGYHIECLLSEPSEVVDGKKQKAHMAISGSSPLISRLGLPGFPAYMPIRSYSKVRIQCGGKITMSLINKEQLNNFLLYGYFMYNVARRRDCGKSFWGFLFENFHISSPAFSIASPAHHDVSIGNNMKEEKQSISTDSPESSSPFNRCLKLNSGSCYLPHPEKEETGGEDAHFICADEHAIGVADGVGGWADLGVNAGLYARELMSNSVNAIQEEPKGSVDPARVLEKAYIKTRARGSSTACIIALTDQGLHAINLGDSGFMVVRDGCTVFRSPVQQHDFNFTYQLESGNSGDLPSSGQVFTIPVAPGDVVIAGTDGLFDNLYNSDITAVVVHAQRAGFSPQVTAQKIVALARQRAQDKDRQTPFSTAAQEAGFRYYGGKLDDITVLVSYITSEHTEKENSSAKSS